jgi:hypothetical protein
MLGGCERACKEWCVWVRGNGGVLRIGPSLPRSFGCRRAQEVMNDRHLRLVRDPTKPGPMVLVGAWELAQRKELKKVNRAAVTARRPRIPGTTQSVDIDQCVVLLLALGEARADLSQRRAQKPSVFAGGAGRDPSRDADEISAMAVNIGSMQDSAVDRHGRRSPTRTDTERLG